MLNLVGGDTPIVQDISYVNGVENILHGNIRIKHLIFQQALCFTWPFNAKSLNNEKQDYNDLY
ncbi:hypothetical protein ccbrp13_45410 [Ktedonobacteria bacterium brp13]|nr:hypothetical protein ccbrp13_45410 [Ktedonobacteria bacterium brp13]